MTLFLRVVRLTVAALIVTAVVVQFFTPQDPWAVAGNFVSFFTIQSNLLAAVVLTVVAVRGGAPRSARLDYARGAVTLYMLITGVVFALLLSNLSEQLQLTRPWVDAMLHQVAPIVVVLDWLVDPPRARITTRAALTWLAYPAAYIAYTLVRGPIVDWYPYPFLDVDAHGYPAVLLNCLALAVGFAVVALVVAAVGNRRSGRPGRVAAAGT